MDELALLSLNELFTLQYEVVRQIQNRIDQQQLDNTSKDLTQKIQGATYAGNDDVGKGEENAAHVRKEEGNDSLEIVEDSQDLVLTQFSSSLTSSQLTRPLRPSIFAVREDGSSPLKEPQENHLVTANGSSSMSRPLSLQRENRPVPVSPSKSSKQIARRVETKIKHRSFKVKKEQLNTKIPPRSSSSASHVKIPSEPISLLTKPTLLSPSKPKKINFNFNPITKKPWILEDFKPNHEFSGVQRGRKKLEQFYSKVGKPNEPITDGMVSSSTRYPRNTGERNGEGNPDFIFDNMRDRSQSPPGYGRMDFPSTQERTDDKIKSQRMIYEKTVYRFQAATDSRIPPFEREYIFKKDALNRAVDDNNFAWDAKRLEVFLRSK